MLTLSVARANHKVLTAPNPEVKEGGSGFAVAAPVVAVIVTGTP